MPLKTTVESLRSDVATLTSLTPEALKAMKGFLFPPYRNYEFCFGTSSAMLTDASGNLGQSSSGSTIATSSISGCPEWSSFQALFDEVFVDEMQIHYMPNDPNGQDPIGLYKSSTSGKSGAPLGICSLYNDVPVFTSVGAMLSNPTMRIKHSADKWVYSWRNAVRRDPHAVSTLTTTEVDIKTQGWCPTDSASIARLVGAMQFIGSNVVSADYYSNNLGTFFTRFRVHFRQRN